MNKRRKDERAVEAPAMMIVIPVLVVLVLTLIDVGNMVRIRMTVENIARDTARSAAADGGNFNARTNTIGGEWDDINRDALWRNGRCTLSDCIDGRQATLECNQVTPANGGSTYNANVAQRAGDLISCTAYYPYEAINKGLLNSPLGLGMGSLLKPFTITQTARAETGTNG